MSIKLNPKIEVRDSPIEGRGLFANEPLRKGEKLQVTYGKHPSVVMTNKEFQQYIKTVNAYDAVYLGNGKHRVSTTSREHEKKTHPIMATIAATQTLHLMEIEWLLSEILRQVKN